MANKIVITLENRALTRLQKVENLQKRIDSLYKKVIKCTCPEQRQEHMLKAKELRDDLFAAKMRYDETMVELYGSAHQRIARNH